MHPISKASLLLGGFLGVALGADAAFAGGISVGIDMSSPVHFTRDATSVVVGNPSIADVYVQNGKLVFLQGRSFGTTNLIALDADGKEIVNVPVTVTASRGETVTLQRGVDGRISYACAARCEPAIMPGDDPEHVKALMDVTSGKTGAADQVATTTTQSSH